MKPTLRMSMLLMVVLAASSAPHAVSPDVVVSQVYGGGGNSGSTFTHDFVELYNRGSLPVDVTGWTVQYASAAGDSWQTTTLSGTIQPGHYYLVQQAPGSGGTAPLPLPETVGTIAMSATAGKVALVRDALALAGACPAGGSLADLVGYGAASCAETSPTPPLSSSTAALRLQGGATDSDSNLEDFAVGPPAPRNGATATAALSGVGAAIPQAVNPGDPALLTVTVSPAGSPSSTGITVTADLTAIGGSGSQVLEDSGSGGDGIAGDNVFSFVLTPTTGSGAFLLPVSIADAEGRTAGASIALTILAPAGDVVISQVYGGGGNTGAEYRNDFIELRNREPFDVSVAGWSVQYSPAGGTSWASTVLTGIIPAGGYYLVQEAAGAGGITPLPAPDAVGTLALAAGSGKVALVAGPALLTGACPDTAVLDLVGYGSASCFEGTAAAPGLSSTLAAVRLEGGLADTNDNAADFASGVPSPKSTVGVSPTGSGAATPASVPGGGTTLLTIRAAAGAFPPSPVTDVTVDLSPIGGGSQPFFDDATHGDLQAGDGIYSYQVVASGAPGFRVLDASIVDARGRSGTTGIRLAIEANTPTAIAVIQGSGPTSPLAGQLVTTTGVVTALRSNGFHLQTPDGADDLDPATSEGLFVFTGAAAAKPSVGRLVRVTGLVSEFGPAPPNPPVTELTGPPAFADVGAGLPLPGPVVLDAADTPPGGNPDQLERLEGMRVQADLRVIAPTDGTVFESTATAQSSGEFYAVVLGLGRPVREPGLDPAFPPPPALPCCVPRFDGNPERLRIDSGAQPGSAIFDVAAGQRILGLTGVLDFAFGSYTIVPDPGAGTIVGAQQATPVAPAEAGEFTVASANLERFFDEHDDPGHDDAVLTGEAVELRMQKASLLVRRVLLSPDVLGVVEVENLSILQRLAARINADAVADGESDPVYVAYLEEGNDIGGIDSGFLVKTSRVDVIGIEQPGKDTTYTPPGVAPGEPLPLLNDRPPLVLTAAVRAPTPLPITVIVNHLRSLSGIDGPDGGRIRAKRRAQAEFLASLIQARQGTERVISVGDYNAFPFNDGLVDVAGTIRGAPAAAEQVALASPDLVEPDLTNLGDSLGPAEQYSFVFEGNAQALDHILVNRLALELVTRTGYARSNADFPESLRSDPSRPERVSDHDAAIAYFRFPAAPVVTLAGPSVLEVEAYTSFEDPGAIAHDDQGPLLVTTTGIVDLHSPGDYTLTYSATTGYLTTTIARVVRVRDTIPPQVIGFRVTPALLKPPDHRFVEVTASYGVADAGGAAACSLSVTSNEPANRPGHGHTDVDWIIADAEHLLLRAERSARGTGRIYRVVVTCLDRAGNSAQDAATVAVPR